jgi:hypothetical protein
MNSTLSAINWSARKKKIAATKAITTTIMVEIIVSRRLGQVTLDASERTWPRKAKGFVLVAIGYLPDFEQSRSNHSILYKTKGSAGPRTVPSILSYEIHIEPPALIHKRFFVS